MIKSEGITVIDLFCGCGGYSLGLEKAGFNILAAIDFNSEAIKVYDDNLNTNSNKTVVLRRDLTTFPPEYLSVIIKTKKVDVIVGGPPCQGFSNLRKRDGANHGPKLIEDPRRHLYKEFLKYVEYFNPYIFVMENVLGIRSAACGAYYKKVQFEARKIGYRVHGVVINANDFGVPQKRRRQLIIGTRQDLPIYFNKQRHLDSFIVKNTVNLGMAICDLPELKAGEGKEISDYEMNLREKYLSEYGSWYLYDVLNVNNSLKLTSHVSRPQSERDLADFSLLDEGENCDQAIKRGVNFRFPYKRTYFKDRYKRQDRQQLCSTIVAHLSKDGLMFIHPTQERSLTPREAARIQSFPDTFQFNVPRTHQYRLIGNAVPPLVGEVIGKSIKKYLEDVNSINNISRDYEFADMPRDSLEAADRLWKLVKLVDNKNALRAITLEEFKAGWFSVAFLYPRLHPDGIIDSNGFGISYDDCLDLDEEIIQKYPRLTSPYYTQSGCPVVLVPIIKEANRRHNNNKLKQDEFYCSHALLAGILFRLNGNFPESINFNQLDVYNRKYLNNSYICDLKGESQ